MRKGLLIVMAFLCSVLAQAEGVSREAALEKARAFMKAKGVVMPGQTDLAASAPHRKAKQQEEACYYVFNADRGYVIVSGDDRTVPILGYSLTGSYDPENIPANMRAWLQGYADQIEALDSLGVTARYDAPDASVSMAQKKTGAMFVGVRKSNNRNAIAPLLTSTWNQGVPYCNNTPVVSYQGNYYYSATGCVATAMAQVVNYHKYPDAVVADIPSYTTTTHGFEMSGIPAGSVIDWENMADDYSSYWNMSAASCQAVANLMLYCGESVEMNYDMSSGAVTAEVASALKTYFGYDENIYHADRQDYTIDRWDDLLYNELLCGRPIVYHGQSVGGGHAFVLDGHDGTSLYHVNWGWGGSCDGYFAVSILNPNNNSGIGASSTSDGYSVRQGAIIGVQPPGYPNPVTPNDMTDRLRTYMLIIDGTLVSCNFHNETGKEGDFDLGYAVVNTATGEENVVYLGWGTLLHNYYFQSISLDISELNLPSGTYRIYPVSRIKGTNNWLCSIDPDVIYVQVTIDTDGSMTTECHPVVSLETGNFRMPSAPQVNSQQVIRTTIINLGDEYNGVLYFMSRVEDEEECSVFGYTGVAIPQNGQTDIEIYFTPTVAKDHHIYVWLDANGDGNINFDTEIIGEGLLTFSEKAPVVDLEVVSISPYNDPVVNEEFRFSATIRNNGDDYSGLLCLFHASETMVEQEGTVWIGMGYNQVDIAAGETLDVDFWFTPDEAGTYYFWLSTSREDFQHIISQHVIDVTASHPSILGDINGDGRVNVADITLLSGYISDSNPTGVRTENADINGDGRITVADVVELARMITNE